MQAPRASGTVPTPAVDEEMEVLLDSKKRKAWAELEASTRKKTKVLFVVYCTIVMIVTAGVVHADLSRQVDDNALASKAKKSPAQKQRTAMPAGAWVAAPPARVPKWPSSTLR